MSLEQSRRPRFGKVPQALEYCGLSRARFYEWARQHPALIKKNGRATLVDYTILDQLLDALPTAADVKADD